MNPQLLQQYADATAQTLEEAYCLPLSTYHDKSVFNAEVTKIFHNDWIYVCTEHQLRKTGDCYVLDIAGEQVIVARDSNDELCAFSNLCRHRGTPLLDLGAGKINKQIACPYHGWIFNDQGVFKGAPHTGHISIDKSEHHLQRFAVDTWNSLVFLNLSPSPQPLSTRTDGLNDYLHAFDIKSFKHSYQMPTEHWNSNWKLAVDNGIESYHLFKVHKETLEKTSPTKKAYYVAGHTEWVLTGGEMVDDRGTVSKWLTGSFPDVYNHYLLLFFPPGFIGIITYDGFNWINILPTGPETCSVTAGGLVTQNVPHFNAPEFDFMAAFLAEDKEICERVQTGTHARIGMGGKLVSLEQILVDFRHYLGNRLFDANPLTLRQTPNATRFLSL